jgi:hypothetical protein
MGRRAPNLTEYAARAEAVLAQLRALGGEVSARSARWIAADARRELASDKVQARLARQTRRQ